MRGYRRFLAAALLPLALLLPALALARPAISPVLRNLETGEEFAPATVITEIPGKGSYINLFLEGNFSEAELTARGVLIGSRLPNGVITAKVPMTAFREVAGLPGISRITAAYKAKKNLDASVPFTQATPNYWTLSEPNFTGNAGAGVIVGNVDTGIDWTNPDFKNPDGTTRILYIWDQNDAVGPNPAEFAYGTQWTAANINAGTPRETDPDAHGTHVMGIAAGDGSNTGNSQPDFQYIGMAPRADIINVATDFSTTGIVDGVNYIFQKAAALGKNAVVNLSLGSQFGAHDGTETFDTAIDALTGAGKIVVASAGNDGNQALHAEQLVPPGGGSQTITLTVPTYTPNASASNDFIVIDAYYPGADNMSVSITSPRGTSNLGPVTKGNYAQKTGTTATDGAVYIENGYTAAPGGATNIYIQIWDYASTRYPRVGSWTITLTPVSTTASTECDLWLANFQLGSAYVQPLFGSDVDEHELVGSPGSANSVITAGAWTSKYSWLSIDGNTYHFTDGTAVGTLAVWSSPGPRSDGVRKPDIAAPGTAIVSTLSADVASPTQALVVPDGVHWVMSGTSMAAPHTAGGVALILAATPGLTPAQVKAKIYADALTDANTGTCPNDQWGYGKLRMLSSDSEDPVVTVTLPNGGQTWPCGGTRSITWTATDNIAVTSITIEYSIDNGSNWLPVSSGEANDGTYSWVIPNTPTTQALVRVTAYDAASNSGSDVSDAVFTIFDNTAPGVTVIAPNGGETWACDSSHNITWTASDNIAVTSITLEYSIDNGSNWLPVASGEANDGSYAWTVPATLTTLALVRVTAFDAASNSGDDVSDAVFTIADQSAPGVTVVSPNGGEVWGIGSSHNITWTATDNIGVTSITIEYSIDNGSNWLPEATGEANDGSYAWTVPNAPTTQALVRVTATDAAANSGNDVSNAVFTIADQSAPSVTVTAPNGGETWACGSAHNITWTATDDVGVTSIDIEYSIDNGANWIPEATGEANDGSYAWTVPGSPTVQALVRVTAHDAASNTGNDVSDAVFTIADQEAPAVTVTAPNGGETWQVAATEQITWTATDNIGVTTVDLYYSNDNGATYNPIATGEANDGTYDWLIPDDPTTQALVRVVAHDAAANAGQDESDATFTIQSTSGVSFLPAVLTHPVVLQNRPNPFNPTTIIGFGLPAPGRVTITIYSIKGDIVRRLVDAEYGQGYSEVLWDGRTDGGQSVSSGVYFYRFQSGTVKETKRLIVSK